MTSRTYLVTGGAGFVGSHLVERLLARGDAATVLDDLSTGSRANLDAVRDHPRLGFVEGDVRDAARVAGLVAEADAVVHLAASVGVRLVLDAPLRTFRTNVDGTAAVLAACAARGTPVLVASSSEVYGRSARLPFREDDDLVVGPPTRPRWGYAAGKLAAEHLALAWRAETGLPARVARIFNTAGPRQTGRWGMVLPRFVAQALAGGPITVHGDGLQTRCFCHVADAVEALLRLVDAPQAAGGVFNVGSDAETTILALAETVRARAGADAPIVHVSLEREYGPTFDDVPRRVPDLARLGAATGFVPSRPLESVVDDVVAWVRAGGRAA